MDQVSGTIGVFGASRRSTEYVQHNPGEVIAILQNGIARYARNPAASLVSIRKRLAKNLDYANPFSAELVQTLIYKRLAPLHVRETLKMVTILHSPWNTTPIDLKIDYASIAAKVRRELTSIHGIFAVEFSYFQNVGFRNSRLVAPHCQGICWGDAIHTVTQRGALRFGGGEFGAIPVVAKDVYDLSGAVRYSFKHPYREYAVYQRRDGRFWHGERELRQKSAFIIWDYARYYGWPDTVFGIGEGAVILNQIAKQTRFWRRMN